MAGMLSSSSCRPSQSSRAFTQQQLKQLRAQCLVFLAIRNSKQPTKKHLEIALGESSAEGTSSGGSGGDNRDEIEAGLLSSSPVVSSASVTAGLPPPDLLALSTLQLSSPLPRSGPITRRIVRRGPLKIQRP